MNKFLAVSAAVVATAAAALLVLAGLAADDAERAHDREPAREAKPPLAGPAH